MEINAENLTSIGFTQLKMPNSLFVLTKPSDETIVFSVTLNQGNPIFNAFVDDSTINHHKVKTIENVEYWLNAYLNYE